MDFSWLENRSWRSRESVKETGRKKEREKEGEGKCQLLLECRSNVQQRGRGRCVCVCVRTGSVGFMLSSSCSFSKMR